MKNELLDLLKISKNEVKRAFTKDPLIVNQSLADKLYDEFYFIPITRYAWKYLDKLITGEVGVFNARRIVINLPVLKNDKRN